MSVVAVAVSIVRGHPSLLPSSRGGGAETDQRRRLDPRRGRRRIRAN